MKKENLMEINTPEQLMAAIKLLVVQMDRKQRKQFLMWIKRMRTEYDFKYPQGYQVKETTNEKKVQVAITEPAPVIVVPDSNIIIPEPRGDVIRDVVSDLKQGQ